MVQENSFKDISYLKLWQPLLAEQNHLCNFGRGHHEEHFCEIILNLDQCFRRCRLKAFITWTSGDPFIWQSKNHFCSVGRSHNEEQFCAITLNLDQWFRRRCRFKLVLVWSSVDQFLRWSNTICAILVEGILRNNSVKLFWIWTSSSEDVV